MTRDEATQQLYTAAEELRKAFVSVEAFKPSIQRLTQGEVYLDIWDLPHTTERLVTAAHKAVDAIDTIREVARTEAKS